MAEIADGGGGSGQATRGGVEASEDSECGRVSVKEESQILLRKNTEKRLRLLLFLAKNASSCNALQSSRNFVNCIHTKVLGLSDAPHNSGYGTEGYWFEPSGVYLLSLCGKES